MTSKKPTIHPAPPFYHSMNVPLSSVHPQVVVGGTDILEKAAFEGPLVKTSQSVWKTSERITLPFQSGDTTQCQSYRILDRTTEEHMGDSHRRHSESEVMVYNRPRYGLDGTNEALGSFRAVERFDTELCPPRVNIVGHPNVAAWSA